MMRNELKALIIASLLTGLGAPAALAQAIDEDGPSIRAIVEMARQERERRAAVQAARQNRVFTTADVDRYVPPMPETVDAVPEIPDVDSGLVAGDLSAGGDVTPGAEATSDEDWLAWQEEVIGLRTRIQSLDDQRVGLELKMTETRGKVTAPTGTLQDRNRALADLAVEQSELEETMAELESASVELEGLLANEPPRPE